MRQKKTTQENKLKLNFFGVCEIFLNAIYLFIYLFILEEVDGITFHFFIGSIRFPLRGRSSLDS